MATILNNFFGIDFGTTNSATVGYTVMPDSTQLTKYGDDEGRPIPSVVAIEKETGRVFTGREAWEKRMELSETCEYIPSIKTILDDIDWETEINGKVWTPVEVAAEVFSTLKMNVSERTGSVLDQATVAIPIGFSPEKRRKLRKAAKMAGINITSFVSEPTAAFFANYNDLKGDSIVTIFDWGGGTLDISIIQHKDGIISELATGGLDIAGDYIDKKLAQRIHAKASRKKGIEVKYNDMLPQCKDMLLVKAERAKREFSDDDTTNLYVHDYGELGTIRETLDYDWFSEVINPEVELAIGCLKKVITESEVGLANIDRIVMVGGSSNLRPITEKLSEMFGEKLYFPEETMWNVGQGAGMLSMNPGEYYSNQDIGVTLSDGTLYKLLEKGTTLKGWSSSVNFGIVDSSEEARFIFSGSNDLDETSARFKTLSIAAYRFLEEKISLGVKIDEDMIFTASAKSNMRSSEFARFWEYSKLKFFYQLPELEGW